MRTSSGAKRLTLTSLFALLGVLGFISECNAEQAPTLSEWSSIPAVLPGEGLYYSSVTQLGPYLVIVGGCRQEHCRPESFSKSIFLFDPVNQRTRTPVIGESNETFPISTPEPPAMSSSSGSASSNSQNNNSGGFFFSDSSSSDTTTSSSQPGTTQAATSSSNSNANGTSGSSSAPPPGPTNAPVAELKYPVAGMSTAVTLLDSVFVLGPCMMTHIHDIQAAGHEIEKELHNLTHRRVQRITLLRANVDNDDPPIISVEGDYAVTNKFQTLGRLNASCAASGDKYVYMVGGVGKSGNSWGLSTSIAQMFISNKAIDVDEGTYTKKVGVSRPAVWTGSSTLFMIGGLQADGTVYDTEASALVVQGKDKAKSAQIQGYAPGGSFYTDPVTQGFMIAGNWVIFNGHYQVAEYFLSAGATPGWNRPAAQSSTPPSFGALWGFPYKGQILFTLFGGMNYIHMHTSVFIWNAQLALTDCCWDGWLTRTNTSTSDYTDAYDHIEWNATVSVVVTKKHDSKYNGEFGHNHCDGATSATTCHFRISLSPRCDVPYLDDIRVSGQDMIRESQQVAGTAKDPIFQYWHISPPFQLPESAEASGVGGSLPRTYLYACFSAGTKAYPKQNCPSNGCLEASTFYAVNQFLPLAVSHPTVITPAPPTPLPPTPQPTTPVPTPEPTESPEHNKSTTVAPATPRPDGNPGTAPFTQSPGFFVIVAAVCLLAIVLSAVAIKNNFFGGSRKKGMDGRTSDGQAGVPVAALGDGRYRVIEKIGKGSFSTVYLVERCADKVRFALKYIQCADENDRKEAMKECEVIAKLSAHPHVIKLEDMFLSYKFDDLTLGGNLMAESNVQSYGSAEGRRALAYESTTNLLEAQEELKRSNSGGRSPKGQDGERYLSLVMEYHDKGDLGQWVRRMRSTREYIPEATIVSVAQQVCSVLQYMHGQKPPIIHRDLKPENLLLASIQFTNLASTMLPMVVSDFGLSRVMDKAFCETGVGSLPYVAPECWRRKYSTKVDIWAVGCILYAMCSKRVDAENVVVMFSESSRPDFRTFLYQQVTKTYQYSDRLATLILSLLEVDVNKRPSAEQVIKCIKKRPAINLDFDALLGSSRANVLMTKGGNMTKSGAFPMAAVVQEFYVVEVDEQKQIQETFRQQGPQIAETSMGGSFGSLDVLAPPGPKKKTPTAGGSSKLGRSPLMSEGTVSTDNGGSPPATMNTAHGFVVSNASTASGGRSRGGPNSKVNTHGSVNLASGSNGSASSSNGVGAQDESRRSPLANTAEGANFGGEGEEDQAAERTAGGSRVSSGGGRKNSPPPKDPLNTPE